MGMLRDGMKSKNVENRGERSEKGLKGNELENRLEKAGEMPTPPKREKTEEVITNFCGYQF